MKDTMRLDEYMSKYDKDASYDIDIMKASEIVMIIDGIKSKLTEQNVLQAEEPPRKCTNKECADDSNHGWQRCKFTQCRLCKKYGHIARYCDNRRPNRQSSSKPQDNKQ